MIHRIVYFLLPWEIDDFQRHVEIYLSGIDFFQNQDNKNIIFNITLDLSDDNLIDWDKSKLPKEYFSNKFMYYVGLLEEYFNVEYNFGGNIKGCSDARREIFNEEFDFVTWVDPDMYFPITILPMLYYISIEAYNQLGKFFIITPSIIKYWDKSWDSICSSVYQDESYDFRYTFNSHKLLLHSKALRIGEGEEVEKMLKIGRGKKTPIFKFFGGMFPTFSKDFYSLIQIPLELCPYGGQDTFLMFVAMMNAYRYDIFQCKINTLVVSENFKSPNKFDEKENSSVGTNHYLKSNFYLRENLRKRKYTSSEIEDMAWKLTKAREEQSKNG